MFLVVTVHRRCDDRSRSVISVVIVERVENEELPPFLDLLLGEFLHFADGFAQCKGEHAGKPAPTLAG